MTDVTIQDLQERVKRVEDDMQKLRVEGGENAGRKLEVLADYKSYLQDEIREIKNEQKANGSS